MIVILQLESIPVLNTRYENIQFLVFGQAKTVTDRALLPLTNKEKDRLGVRKGARHCVV